MTVQEEERNQMQRKLEAGRGPIQKLPEGSRHASVMQFSLFQFNWKYTRTLLYSQMVSVRREPSVADDSHRFEGFKQRTQAGVATKKADWACSCSSSGNRRLMLNFVVRATQLCKVLLAVPSLFT